jgi:hypothetical protein
MTYRNSSSRPRISRLFGVPSLTRNSILWWGSGSATRPSASPAVGKNDNGFKKIAALHKPGTREDRIASGCSRSRPRPEAQPIELKTQILLKNSSDRRA